MAYTYLLDMYEFIDQRLAATKNELVKKNGEPAEIKFIEGRNRALSEFQNFLVNNYIPKLPRRIREGYFSKNSN